MPFRSDRLLRRLSFVALAGIILVPLPRVTPSIAQSSTVIIQRDTVQTEDLYAFGNRVFVEGTVQGDLVVATGELVVTGTVEGDVLGLVWGTARIGGRVDGSVRLAALSVETSGSVGDDLAVATLDGDLRGEVQRDLLQFALNLDLGGRVERLVRGQVWNLDIGGTVDRDVDVAVRSLTVGGSAVIGGDLVYRSNATATISPDASIGGQIVQRDPSSPIEIRILRRILSVVTVLGFIFGGMVLIWLLRRTTLRAAGAVRRRPVLSLGVGLGALLLGPLVIGLLAVTLAGLPVAVVFGGLWLGALFFGPLPAVADLGGRILRGRGGLMGAFVLGAVLWRGALWLIPFLVPVVAFLLWAAAVAWGTGGWILGAWETRHETGFPEDDLYERRRPERRLADVPTWDAPLPPRSRRAPADPDPDDVTDEG